MPAGGGQGWRAAASIVAKVTARPELPATSTGSAVRSVQHLQRNTNLQQWKDGWAAMFPREDQPGDADIGIGEEVHSGEAGSSVQESESVGAQLTRTKENTRVRTVRGRTGDADSFISLIAGVQRTQPVPPVMPWQVEGIRDAQDGAVQLGDRLDSDLDGTGNTHEGQGTHSDIISNVTSSTTSSTPSSTMSSASSSTTSSSTAGSTTSSQAAVHDLHASQHPSPSTTAVPPSSQGPVLKTHMLSQAVSAATSHAPCLESAQLSAVGPLPDSSYSDSTHNHEYAPSSPTTVLASTGILEAPTAASESEILLAGTATSDVLHVGTAESDLLTAGGTALHVVPPHRPPTTALSSRSIDEAVQASAADEGSDHTHITAAAPSSADIPPTPAATFKAASIISRPSESESISTADETRAKPSHSSASEAELSHSGTSEVELAQSGMSDNAGTSSSSLENTASFRMGTGRPLQTRAAVPLNRPITRAALLTPQSPPATSPTINPPQPTTAPVSIDWASLLRAAKTVEMQQQGAAPAPQPATHPQADTAGSEMGAKSATEAAAHAQNSIAAQAQGSISAAGPFPGGIPDTGKTLKASDFTAPAPAPPHNYITAAARAAEPMTSRTAVPVQRVAKFIQSAALRPPPPSEDTLMEGTTSSGLDTITPVAGMARKAIPTSSVPTSSPVVGLAELLSLVKPLAGTPACARAADAAGLQASAATSSSSSGSSPNTPQPLHQELAEQTVPASSITQALSATMLSSAAVAEAPKKASTADIARSFLARFSQAYAQKQQQRQQVAPTAAAADSARAGQAASGRPATSTTTPTTMQILLSQTEATETPGLGLHSTTGVGSKPVVPQGKQVFGATSLLGRLSDLAKSLVQPAPASEVKSSVPQRVRGRSAAESQQQQLMDAIRGEPRPNRKAGMRAAEPLSERRRESVDLMEQVEERREQRAKIKEAAAAGTSSSRWASKLQSLKQPQDTAAQPATTAVPEKAAAASKGPLKATKAEEETTITIPAGVSVMQLAHLLGVATGPLETFLESLGDVIKSEHDSVSAESAELAALEFGKLAICLRSEPAAQEPRNPVVTIMGHVDHGKTSLLDALRKTSVAASEAGGITQHVGAFEVKMPESQSSITFLDTPGHAAFTAMRARGAAVTDIVVLVVAADDGVMPQTREAIAHARAADCPIVVAITKCDLPQAKVDLVKSQLGAEGLELEEFGGHIQVVETCALKGQGLRELEEAILLQAELMELKAAQTGAAEATVVEASLDKKQGVLATVIVKQGRLEVGDCIVVGTEYGKVRAVKRCDGGKLQSALPGQPCQIIGLKGLPLAGDQLLVVVSEERGRKISLARSNRADDFRRSQMAQRQLAALEKARAVLRAETAARKKLKNATFDAWSRAKTLSSEDRRVLEDGTMDTQTKLQKLGLVGEQERAELEALNQEEKAAEVVSVLVKADVHGSMEAVQTALQQLDSPRVAVKLIYCGVGPLTESDVDLAASTGAAIVTFNLPSIRGNVEAAIKQRSIKVLNHRVIYHLLDDVQRMMEGACTMQEEEVVVGTAEVLATFPLTKAGRKEVGRIAGCKVKDGSIDLKSFCFRVTRDGVTVWEGPATSIKRDRQEVDSVGRNTECGVVLESGKFSDFKVGDLLLCVKKQVGGAAALAR